MALLSSPRFRGQAEAGLSFLSRLQSAEGGVAAWPGVGHASWPTALAALAWQAGQLGKITVAPDSPQRAIDWLLRQRGRTFTSDPRVYGHNTQLIGWPWIDDTHTWLEPTAYALMALRAADRSDHIRYHEGVQVILDRAIEGGGWNYGNRKMLGADLRPLPETTGVILVAMAGEPPDPRLETGLRFLQDAWPRVTAPLGWAWSLLALDAWNRRPIDTDRRAGQIADMLLGDEIRPLEDAMVLIATDDQSVFGKLLALKTVPSG